MKAGFVKRGVYCVCAIIIINRGNNKLPSTKKSNGLAQFFDGAVLHIPVFTSNTYYRPLPVVGGGKAARNSETTAPMYHRQKGKWRLAKTRFLVSGEIIGEQIEIKPNENFYILFTNQTKSTSLGSMVDMKQVTIAASGASERL